MIEDSPALRIVYFLIGRSREAFQLHVHPEETPSTVRVCIHSAIQVEHVFGICCISRDIESSEHYSVIISRCKWARHHEFRILQVSGIFSNGRERKSMLTLIHHGVRLVEEINNFLSVLGYHCSRMITTQSIIRIGLT